MIALSYNCCNVVVQHCYNNVVIVCDSVCTMLRTMYAISYDVNFGELIVKVIIIISAVIPLKD